MRRGEADRALQTFQQDRQHQGYCQPQSQSGIFLTNRNQAFVEFSATHHEAAHPPSVSRRWSHSPTSSRSREEIQGGGKVATRLKRNPAPETLRGRDCDGVFDQISRGPSISLSKTQQRIVFLA
ncbi:hypothetical protein COP2_035030 [Malus domestica]